MATEAEYEGSRQDEEVLQENGDAGPNGRKMSGHVGSEHHPCRGNKSGKTEEHAEEDAHFANHWVFHFATQLKGKGQDKERA